MLNRVRIGRKLWLAAAVAIAVLAAVFVPLRFAWTDGRDTLPLSLEEAKQQVLQAYDGEITRVALAGDHYVIRLRSATGVYELNVDGSGISAIRQLEGAGNNAGESTSPPAASPDDTGPAATAEPPVAGSPTPKPSHATDQGPSSGPSSEPSSPSPEATPDPDAFIKESEAAATARRKVAGEVKDIDLEQASGKWYYFVEIETDDRREVVVQLHGASGEIVSVTWDDESDDSPGSADPDDRDDDGRDDDGDDDRGGDDDDNDDDDRRNNG